MDQLSAFDKRIITTVNNQPVEIAEIPVISYEEFLDLNTRLLRDATHRHCVNLFGSRELAGGVINLDSEVKSEISNGDLLLYCCIADDELHKILISSTLVKLHESYASLTAVNHNFEGFERELNENFGIQYNDHPWLKPVRYSHDRHNPKVRMSDHPFLRAGGEELHEVGVGPVHAGVIEPGHFRFLCNGEQIMHLEIQLGYQHRGVEKLFLKKKKLIERSVLAEQITGDTVAGHTSVFANLWESLCGVEVNYERDFAKTVAAEIERMAIHTGDLAAICADIAYQLGNAVYGRLRTPLVNFFQEWGGNRLGKGLIRPARINYPFTEALKEKLLEILKDYEKDFDEMTEKFTSLPSTLSRMEKTGVVSYNRVLEIGTVGMSARMSGLTRDIRASHPYNLYGKLIDHKPVVKHHGDVYSRVQIRKEEIKQSIGYLRELMNHLPEERNDSFSFESWDKMTPMPGTFIVSLAEGWRGEICHCAVTGNQGELILYKIKDPSFHNWMALAQAVRDNGISDFPVCNKSFNLSYCGHDL